MPAGPGPFKSWEDCAVDPLANRPAFVARNKVGLVGGKLSMPRRSGRRLSLGRHRRGLRAPPPIIPAGQCGIAGVNSLCARCR